MDEKNRLYPVISILTVAFLAVSCLSGCSAFLTMPPESKAPVTETEAETCITTNDEISDTAQPEEAHIVMKSSWKLEPGKDTETIVYQYVTDKPGPKIVIIGGTHGDEVAGWTAALNLIDELNTQSIPGICGELLIIPQLNIIADDAVKRYVSQYNGVSYSDLNRAFPIERASDASAASIELAEACIQTVKDFIGEDYAVITDQETLSTNLCIIDLHESRGAQSDGYLGNDLIYTNNTFLMESVLDYYNTTYRKTGEAKFVHDEATKSGSFSMCFSEMYPDAVVFTVETNRQVSNGSDTIALSTRTRQQRNILNTLFDMVWNRIDKSQFD